MRNIWLIFKQTARRSVLMAIVAAASAVLSILFFTLLAASGKEAEENGGIIDINYGVRLGVVDNDESPLSEDLKKYFTECLGMEIEEEKNYDFQADMLIDRNISAIIEIPQGFLDSAASGDLLPLTITTLDDYENAAFINVYAESYMQGAEIMSAAARGDEKTFLNILSSDLSAGSVTSEALKVELDTAERLQDAFSAAEGFMLMFTAAIMIPLSYIIMNDRRTGVYSRTVCSVIKPVEYVIGIGLFGVICCSVSNLIFTLFIFCANPDISISIWTVIAVNELFIMFSAGMALIFAQIIKSEQTLFGVGVGYTTIGCMIGGVWFPIADGLGTMGHIAKFFPQYWVMDLIRKLPDDPGYNILPNICILVLFAVLSYLVSAVIFTRKNN